MDNRDFLADAQGYYGEFGGAFVPELLFGNVEGLRLKYRAITDSPEFQQEFQYLLRDFVGRPNPLYFADRLSAHTRLQIYLKREDLNHTGAHKINSALGQILLARHLGKRRIIAETGAGQHGVATATVCARFGLECVVYMGEIDMARQSPNVARMRYLGAKVVPVKSGSRVLKDATNEAIRDWLANPEDTYYLIGSVVGPHPYPEMIARFQSVISAEIRDQFSAQTGKALPDYVLACVGGGSNAIGAFYHFLAEDSVNLIAIEAAGEGVDTDRSAATMALGRPGIIHGARTLLMQDADGQILEAHSASAGLDYPGIGPQHAHLRQTGRVRYVSVTDNEAFRASLLLSRLEGIIPALESAHAIAHLERLEAAPQSNVVVCLSGRGDKDIQSYIEYLERL